MALLDPPLGLYESLKEGKGRAGELQRLDRPTGVDGQGVPGGIRGGTRRRGSTLTGREDGRSRDRLTARVYTFRVRSDVPLPGATEDEQDADVQLFRAENGRPRPFEPGDESRVYRSEGGTRRGAI